MANSVVGTAYLEIVPKLSKSGMPSTLPGGVQAGKQYGEDVGKGAQSAIGAKAVAIGNILANVAMKAGQAFGQIFKDTLENYANYQQLVGGVDTLFKDASAQVQANAAEAFRTAGMSANEYMENVTSFSASLIQSLGGDTQKAADYADMAIRDMSDNANKMGTDMQRITDAYQSFARGQYQLLDNLKLGYGGTKTEMERLLADAEKISGIHYDISSYADIVEAIHVVQTEMGITGTTAEEAAHTISGSINSMKAAWTNFLTGLMNGEANMSELFKQLADSVVTVAKNIVPAIGNLGLNIVEMIGGKEAADAARATFERLSAGFKDFASRLAPIGGAIKRMAATLAPIFQSIATKIASVVESIGSVLSQVLPPILSVVVPIVQTLVSVIATGVNTIWSIIEPLVSWIAQNVAPVIAAFFEFISPLVQQFADVVSQRMQQVRTVIDTVMNAIMPIVTAVWNAIVGHVTNAVNTVKTVISGIKSVINVVRSVFNAVKNAITAPINAAKTAISNAIDTIKGIFSGLHLELPHIKVPHFNISGGEPPWGIAGKGTAPNISIDWYAQGGFVDNATLIGAGERGTEFIWPSYSPYLQRYAAALAGAMGGGGQTIVIQNMTVEANDVDEFITSVERRLGALGRM